MYTADRKVKVGVFSELERMKRDTFALFVRWFRATSDPPEQFGKFSDLTDCLVNVIADQEAIVRARFSYERDKVASVFSPIQIGSEAGIFDEVIGFTGVKRSTEGKLLYQLEVSLGNKRLEHNVTFFQKIRLSEELPLSLLDIAMQISNLGFKKRE